MKRKKKLLGVTTAMVLGMSMSMVAFAGSDSKPVDGYGTLYGSVSTTSVGGSQVVTVTSVTSNPDNAYLKTKIELQDSGGSTLKPYDKTQEYRGGTYFPYNFEVPHFDDVSKIFAAHNVQGGGTYDAQVVYTATTDIAN